MVHFACLLPAPLWSYPTASHPRRGTSSDAPRVVEQAMAGGPPILLVAVVGKFVDDDRVVALTIVLLERMCGKHCASAAAARRWRAHTQTLCLHVHTLQMQTQMLHGRLELQLHYW